MEYGVIVLIVQIILLESCMGDLMTEKRIDLSKLTLNKDKFGDLTVESARDVLNELIEQGYEDFELLIGYDSNLVYTGFTDKVYADLLFKKIMVKE